MGCLDDSGGDEEVIGLELNRGVGPRFGKYFQRVRTKTEVDTRLLDV